MRKLLVFIVSAVVALTANAQVATSDAAWCDAMRQALQDNGIQANVRCDIQSGQKVMQVTTNGKTAKYYIRNNNGQIDYSSPVYIIADPFALRQGYASRGRGQMAWLGERSSIYMPDEVYTLPADVDMLEARVRTAINNVDRITMIDGDFPQSAINSGVPMLVLRSSVISIQRGEKFVPQKPEERNHRPRVERTFAHANVHFELVNYRTGEIVWQTDATDSDNTISTMTDPMENVARTISNRIANRLHDLYPSRAPRLAVQGNVLKVNEIKKDKAESVFINLGSSNDLYKGDTFAVYEVFNVNGQGGQTQIGTISITEVQGPELSLCKVKKGEREILNALQKGSSLVVRSTY